MLIYYSVYGLFATWLQSELKVPAAVVATPVLLSNLANFAAAFVWGATADRIGRRPTIILQALSGCIVAPVYLLTGNLNLILAGFVAQGFFGGSVPALSPAYMMERFPTEVRATASAFCYHFGLIFGGLVPAVASYFAVEQQTGFAVPMLIGYLLGAATLVSALLLSPETKGKVFVADLMKQ
jgi:SHS family lactate transporter-like MFS transporter